MTPVHKAPPWVFERQRFLLETLQVKYPRLQPIYKGVLIVVHDEMNPDRIALASHGLRELSEHLMREVGVARSNYNLGSEVHNLRPHWEKVAEDAKVCSGGCSNCTGGGLRKFLKILLKFFERHAENRPKALAKAS